MSEKCILDPERDCLGLMKAQKLEEEVADLRAHNDGSHKEFFNRLAVLEAHNQVQDAHYSHIIEKLSDITDKLGNLSTRISAIEFKPAKKWESIAEKVLLAIVGAVIGFMMTKLGFK